MSESALEDFLSKEQKVLEDIDPEIITLDDDYFNNSDHTDLIPEANISDKPISSIPKMNSTKSESEALVNWKKEFERKLKEKDDKEIREKEELEKKAKLELEDWKKRNSQLVADNKNLNNSKRETNLEVNGNYSANDPAIWNKIWSLCSNTNLKAKCKDTTRMKSILETMGNTKANLIKNMD